VFVSFFSQIILKCITVTQLPFFMLKCIFSENYNQYSSSFFADAFRYKRCSTVFRITFLFAGEYNVGRIFIWNSSTRVEKWIYDRHTERFDATKSCGYFFAFFSVRSVLSRVSDLRPRKMRQVHRRIRLQQRAHQLRSYVAASLIISFVYLSVLKIVHDEKNNESMVRIVNSWKKEQSRSASRAYRSV